MATAGPSITVTEEWGNMLTIIADDNKYIVVNIIRRIIFFNNIAFLYLFSTISPTKRQSDKLAIINNKNIIIFMIYLFCFTCGTGGLTS